MAPECKNITGKRLEKIKRKLVARKGPQEFPPSQSQKKGEKKGGEHPNERQRHQVPRERMQFCAQGGGRKRRAEGGRGKNLRGRLSAGSDFARLWRTGKCM